MKTLKDFCLFENWKWFGVLKDEKFSFSKLHPAEGPSKNQNIVQYKNLMTLLFHLNNKFKNRINKISFKNNCRFAAENAKIKLKNNKFDEHLLKKPQKMLKKTEKIPPKAKNRTKNGKIQKNFKKLYKIRAASQRQKKR